ncbi:MAG TPA: biopolymer transporter ExbD [Nostocaceae cyanobacterium]|nr:biopolymer transporter ExbD [Nostocaceae cyanobacterium]
MKVKFDNPSEEVQIQILPLIDVVFCILTFFLLAAVNFTRQQAISYDLPSASTGTAISNSPGNQDLFVTISTGGQLYIEKEPIRTEELEPKLRQYIQANPSGSLVLYASPTALYNDVIQTVDTLRKVGGSRVSFATIAKPSQSETNPQGIPTNPSIPLPNGIPLPGLNPQGVNPNLPTDPNQFSPPGQGINPNGLPSGVPQVPVVPGGVPNTVPLPNGNPQGNLNPSVGGSPADPNAGVPQAPTAPKR